MKILIVTQHYWPENFRITDIAETFVSLGHQVTVLTGLPNYPEGYIYDGYRHGENRIQDRNGVHIVRAKEIERGNDIIHRLLNYYSFPHNGKKLAKKLDKDFDVVLISESSPLMCAYPGLKYAKINNKKVVMYAMDPWPISLIAGGIKKNSFIYKHYKKVSVNIYTKCDKILVSTKEHIDYIKSLPKCSSLNIEYLPQYAGGIFEQSNYQTIDNDVIDLMFAGNIGIAQSVETIIKTANILKDDNRFKFHIVGDGIELEKIKKLSNDLGLNNVIFYSNKPLDEMPKLYSLADVMLVTLENKEYAELTIPGKIQSYMAAGKPIIGAINGAGNNFIKDNDIGYTCSAEDYEQLANIISHLNIDELNRIGSHAKKVYQESYSKDKFIQKLISDLEQFKS